MQQLTSAALEEFSAAARHLSFAKAAAELGMHPSVFSRRIKDLEKQLSVRLFDRDTRRVTLTDAGAVLLEHAREIHTRLNDASTAIAALASKPAGTLRLTVPILFGQLHIAPLIPKLLARHPDLKMELTFSDKYEDLAQSGFDAAVRIGALEAGGNLRVRKLAPNHRILCASPAYLAAAGTPRHPSDLAQHRLLSFRPIARQVWRLRGPGGVIDVAVDPVLTADNMEPLRRAAVAGAGIAILAAFGAAKDLADGRLVPVFRDYHPLESTISVVYRDAPHLPRRVRVLIDFLVEAFKGTPPWEVRREASRNKPAKKRR